MEGLEEALTTIYMKRILTLAALACSLLSASAQSTQNLFPPTVTDADGWLWFNNQSVINTYVGGIVFKLPALATLSICLSCESKVYGRLTATTNPNNDIFKFVSGGQLYPLDSDKGNKVIQVYSVFKKLMPAGIKEWTGLENLHNGKDPVTIKSDKPIYVFFQNGTQDTVYIHGVRITIPSTASGITAVTPSASATTAVYTADGRYLGTRLSGLGQGLYMVRENGKTRKVVIR